jgi:hypothetical protein
VTTFVMTDTEIWANQYPLTSVANSLEYAGEVNEVDATTFGGAGHREFRGGLRQTAIQVMTFTDYSVDVESLHGAANVVLTAVGEGNDLGNDAIICRGLTTALTRGAAVGEMFKTDVTFRGSAPEGVLRGKLAQPRITRTATGSSTAINAGNVSATQAVWLAVHVFAVSGGSPTLTVKLQSGTTQSGATTDRITATQFTSPGVYLAKLNGAITAPWWRINATIGGSTPSFDFAAAIAIV